VLVRLGTRLGMAGAETCGPDVSGQNQANATPPSKTPRSRPCPQGVGKSASHRQPGVAEIIHPPGKPQIRAGSTKPRIAGRRATGRPGFFFWPAGAEAPPPRPWHDEPGRWWVPSPAGVPCPDIRKV